MAGKTIRLGYVEAQADLLMLSQSRRGFECILAQCFVVIIPIVEIVWMCMTGGLIYLGAWVCVCLCMRACSPSMKGKRYK